MMSSTVTAGVYGAPLMGGVRLREHGTGATLEGGGAR